MNTILKLGPNSVVSQPGDPLLSPDGTVSVAANNDGTATLTKPGTSGTLAAPVLVFDNFSIKYNKTNETYLGPLNGTIRMKGPFTVTVFDQPNTIVYVPIDEDDPPSTGDYEPVTPPFILSIYDGDDDVYFENLNYVLGNVSNFDSTTPTFTILSNSGTSQTGTVSITRPYENETKTLATTDQIPTVPTIPSTSSLLKGNGAGGVSAATAGTDYLTPSSDTVTRKLKQWALFNEYSSTSTYAVGDHVTYDGRIYRCSTAVTTAEAFNSSKWSARTALTNVLNMFANVTTNLTNIATFLNSVKTSTVSVGSRASSPGTWSFSSNLGTTWDNKFRFYHWGFLGIIYGAVKCAAALSASTNYTSLGTVSVPSGYSILSANIGGSGVGEFWSINGSGVISVRNITSKTANTTLGARFLVCLGSIADTYSRSGLGDI